MTRPSREDLEDEVARLTAENRRLRIDNRRLGEAHDDQVDTTEVYRRLAYRKIREIEELRAAAEHLL